MIQCRLVTAIRQMAESPPVSTLGTQIRDCFVPTIHVIAKIFSFKNLWQSEYYDENATKTILFF